MTRFTLAVISLFLFGASLVSVLGYTTAPVSSHAMLKPTVSPTRTCVVKVVFDGDTLGCDLNRNGRIDGKPEHVRMLGIDAPEMHYSRKNKTGKDMPFAREAKQRAEALTLHRKVMLIYDIQKTDIYHRQLAFVYLEPERHTMLNALLLKEGLAKTLFMGKNRQFEKDFYRFEASAREQHRNVWK